MKQITLIAFFIIHFLSGATAQELPALDKKLAQLKPTNIFPATAAVGYEFKDKNKETTPSVFSVKKAENGMETMTAEVFTAVKSHFGVQTIWKNTAAVKRGDKLLARLRVRAIYAKQESGDAVVNFMMQQAMPPNTRQILVEISVGPEWRTMEIPFEAQNDLKIGEATIGFTFGALAQKVEIEVLNFQKKIPLNQLPSTKLTYRGREKDAIWRENALKRIENIRTAPLSIKVVDGSGKPVEGATVTAKLVQSDFVWGTSVNEALLANDQLPDAANYRRHLKEFFNTAVIENGFKAATWQGKPQLRTQTLRAFEWLQENGFRQRGHNLVWPGWKFNAKSLKTLAETDTAAFRAYIENDVRTKMAVTKGKVIAWDVINEFLHEKDFFKYLPADIAIQWFKLAKELDPQAQLFINEYSMLNNVASPANIREYLQVIAELRAAGAPIEAIGIQGHVGRQPRNPEQVLTDLDMFTPVGLPVQITEFDINMPDEDLQADYTRDFLIACYSHPLVTGFTKWGFWQSAHWKPDAAMFRKDWSEKPSAAVWREWVTKKWTTNVTQTTDNQGIVNTRGYLGRYEITLTKGSKTMKKTQQLTQNAGVWTVDF
jgi:endo-1,4-beta-xylanase